MRSYQIHLFIHSFRRASNVMKSVSCGARCPYAEEVTRLVRLVGVCITQVCGVNMCIQMYAGADPHECLCKG